MYSPPDPGDPNDPNEDEIRSEALKARANLLLERSRSFDDELRQIGLYVDDMSVVAIDGPDGPEVALAVTAEIGDVAFSKRVQDPEQDDVDDEFRQMQVSMANDEFLDNRDKIQKAIKEGRDPLDLDD